MLEHEWLPGCLSSAGQPQFSGICGESGGDDAEGDGGCRRAGSGCVLGAAGCGTDAASGRCHRASAARPRQGGAPGGAGRDAVFRSGQRPTRKSSIFVSPTGRRAVRLALSSARGELTRLRPMLKEETAAALEKRLARYGSRRGQIGNLTSTALAATESFKTDHHGDEPADAAHAARGLAAHLRGLQAGRARIRGRSSTGRP